MTDRDKRPILIAGPTASGKSALALRLAEQFGGIIINADSMQVYRELAILTARPSPQDEARAPHALYGHVGVREPYSVGRWIEDAREALAEAERRNLRPVVVGGTGLYFKALLEGLSPLPHIPDAVRKHWRNEAARRGAAELHAILAERDPVMAGRLRPSDPQRITRALEVLEATGRSLHEWQQQPGAATIAPEAAVRLRIDVERAVLWQRCDARLDAMIAAGALEEVRALMRLDLDPELPAMRALGVQPLMQALAGKLSLEAAVKQAKAETRQYAKRQQTWLRGNMRAWTSVLMQENGDLRPPDSIFIDC